MSKRQKVYLIKLWLKTLNPEGHRFPGTGKRVTKQNEPKETLQRHLLIKMTKVKEILKAARERVTCE